MSRKIDWPETVKVAWLKFDGTEDWWRVPIELGEKEVAVILALQLDLYNTQAGALAEGWLHRRSEPVVKAAGGYSDVWDDDPGVIDYVRAYIATNVVGTTWKVYPYPIVLIRQPSLILNMGSFITGTLGIWYVRQKVTDAELAELMVKDHA